MAQVSFFETRLGKHTEMDRLPEAIHTEVASFIGLDYLRLRACSRAYRATLDKGHLVANRLREGDLMGLFQLYGHTTRLVATSHFNEACNRGHLTVMQWLVSRFGLTADDARANDNLALVRVCSQGHLAAAQWLVAHFGLTVKDMRNSYYALPWACIGGHSAMAQWLVARFGLTVDDVRSGDILRYVCAEKNLEMAKWLATRFELTAADARSSGALRWACGRGHLVTAQWLVAHFGLTADDAKNCTSTEPATAAWLADFHTGRL